MERPRAGDQPEAALAVLPVTDHALLATCRGLMRDAAPTAAVAATELAACALARLVLALGDELPCAPGARVGGGVAAPSFRAASLIELRPAGATRRAASFGP